MQIYNDNKVIIQELARKYGTSYAVIKEAVEMPFEYIYQTLKEIDIDAGDKLPEFYIRNFGKFKVKFRYWEFREDDNK